VLQAALIATIVKFVVNSVPIHLLHNAIFASTHWRNPLSRVVYRVAINGKPVIDDWYIWLGGVRSRTLEEVVRQCVKWVHGRQIYVCNQGTEHVGNGVAKIVATRATKLATVSPLLTRYILGMFRIPDRFLGEPVESVLRKRGFKIVNREVEY